MIARSPSGRGDARGQRFRGASEGTAARSLSPSGAPLPGGCSHMPDQGRHAALLKRQAGHGRPVRVIIRGRSPKRRDRWRNRGFECGHEPPSPALPCRPGTAVRGRLGCPGSSCAGRHGQGSVPGECGPCQAATSPLDRHRAEASPRGRPIRVSPRGSRGRSPPGGPSCDAGARPSCLRFQPQASNSSISASTSASIIGRTSSGSISPRSGTRQYLTPASHSGNRRRRTGRCSGSWSATQRAACSKSALVRPIGPGVVSERATPRRARPATTWGEMAPWGRNRAPPRENARHRRPLRRA